MRTFYAIQSLVVRPNSDERLHLGLLFNNGNRAWYNYSPKRLELAAKLVGEDESKLIKSLVKGLKNQIDESNLNNKMNWIPSDWSESYIAHLSDYSTNLVRFEKPVNIDIEANESNFRALFEKLISPVKTEKQHAKKGDFIPRTSKLLKTQLGTRTNINIEVKPDMLNGLVFPVKLASIGKNEAPFVCDPIDFEQHGKVVREHISKLMHVINAFMENDTKEFAVFAIGNEPNKKAPNHLIWENLRASHNIRLLPESEFDQVVNHVEEHDVRPWVTEEVDNDGSSN